MNSKKTVAVIGNNCITEILALILPDTWDVVKITDVDQAPLYRPYYPNDVTTGIMGSFLETTGLINKMHFVKKVETIQICLAKETYKFPCSFEDFMYTMIEYFPNDKDSIQEIFCVFKKIGDEWAQYFTNLFSDGEKIFKESGKYVTKSMRDITELFRIQTTDIEKIFNAFLPIDDETIAVYAGYFYTQFFDINSCSKNAFDHICSVGMDKVKKIQTKSINNVLIEHDQPEHKDSVCASFIIDCRNTEDSNNDNISSRGSFKTDDCTLTHNTVIYIKTDEIWIHIWNRQILNQCEHDCWDFDFYSYKGVISDNELKQIIMQRLSIGIDFLEVYKASYNKRYFHADTLQGYAWAFNKKTSAKDPMNIFLKQKKHVINCGIWGYAWFCAAYHIRNILCNQVSAQDNNALFIVSEDSFNE